MTDAVFLTLVQRSRERSVLLGMIADLGILTLMTASGVLGGSLTMVAETLRAWLALAVELFSLVVLRRVHRGSLHRLEYGSGKLEQVVNVAIGSSMVLAAAWIAWRALATFTGEREVGPPLGLAPAAIVGAVNCYINLLAWDAVRQSARGGDSLLMETQVTLRLVKLVASVVVGVTMAIAALSADHLVSTWADGAGGLFVSIYILAGARKILGKAIPDLMDRSAGQDVVDAVGRCLARHPDAFIQIDSIRSRRSGHTVFVEIGLAFAAGLTVTDVHDRINAIRTTLEEEIPDGDFTIVAVPAE